MSDSLKINNIPYFPEKWGKPPVNTIDVQKAAVSSTIWQYDEATKKISRIKTQLLNGKIETNTTLYKSFSATEELGKGASNLLILKPEGNGKGKEKIAKTASLGNGLEDEYKISLKYPYKATGLMIWPKALLLAGDIELMIMPKYDGSITGIVASLKLEEKLNVIYQISCGLDTLHKLGIAHNDLHVDNILCSKKKNRYDISDFEFATIGNSELIKEDTSDLRYFILAILLGKKQIDRETVDVTGLPLCLTQMGYSTTVAKLVYDAVTNKKYDAGKICQQVKRALEEFKKT